MQQVEICKLASLRVELVADVGVDTYSAEGGAGDKLSEDHF